MILSLRQVLDVPNQSAKPIEPTYSTGLSQVMSVHASRRTKEMIMSPQPAKDIVRLQFDVRRAQLNIIDALQETCGLSSKKELFSNAMALMKWAVEETQKGRKVASYDPVRDEVVTVALPALSFSQASGSIGPAMVTTQEGNFETDARGRPAMSAPRLGLVSGV